MKRGRRFILVSSLALFAMAILSAQPLNSAVSFENSTDIGVQYERGVLPLLQKKCTACHSQVTERPFFYDLPLFRHWTRSYVDDKIQRALSSFEILPELTGVDEEISPYAMKIMKVIKERRMPPAPYLLLHPSHRVTQEEKRIISEWATLKND